jgi:hypothetical protein
MLLKEKERGFSQQEIFLNEIFIFQLIFVDMYK